MRIAVDAHSIGCNLAGNGVYTYNLVCNLVREFPEHEWILYCAEKGKELLPDDVLKHARVRVLRSANPIVRYAIEMPCLLKKDKPQLIHTQYWGPLWGKCPLLLLIHDISYVRFPHFFAFPDRMRMRMLIPFFIKRATRVLTISQFSRQEIVDYYSLDKDRVDMVYAGVDCSLFRCDIKGTNRQIQKRYGVEGPYVLIVGSLQPRKNIEGIFKAFALHVATQQQELKIVVVGPDGWLDKGIRKMPNDYPVLKDRVVFTGHIDNESLREMYRNAVAFIYVPFYEGFGLPVLEAMACGVPVIASRCASLPEVGGNAPYYVDPEAVESIGNGICAVVSNATLREHMIKKGLVRAREFSWKRTAQETLKVYSKTIEQSCSRREE